MTDVSDSGASPTWTEERVERLPGWLIGIAVALALGYAGFVVLLWRLGLFDVPAGGPDARVFAAVFALVGALFGAILTFAAALLKHTIDMRTLALNRQTERRLTLENRQTEERLRVENAQTDARLRLDTSIRAIALLANEDGSNAPPTKRAGALFALTHLNQTDLALTLLSQMWPEGDFAASAAVKIINTGLVDADPHTQFQAASVYRDNFERVFVPASGNFEIPEVASGLSWPIGVEFYSRQLLLSALLQILGSHPRSYWDEGVLLTIAIRLDDAIRRDPYGPIRVTAAVAVLTLIEDYPDDFEVFLESGTQDLGTVRRRAKDLLGERRDIGQWFERDLQRLYATWGSEPPQGFEYLGRDSPGQVESLNDAKKRPPITSLEGQHLAPADGA